MGVSSHERIFAEGETGCRGDTRWYRSCCDTQALELGKGSDEGWR
jgi:hypothetical protein